MPHRNLTRVTFKVEAELEVGQNVRLTGDTWSLGGFSPNRGLDLVTTPEEFPVWRTSRPVNLPKGIPLAYKYVVMSGGQFSGWEPISAHARIVTPDGPELTIIDRFGEYTEPGDGTYEVPSAPASSPRKEGKVRPGGLARKGSNKERVHPHVRFAMDQETPFAASSPDAAQSDAGSASSLDPQVPRTPPNQENEPAFTGGVTKTARPSSELPTKKPSILPTPAPVTKKVKYRMFLVSFDLPVNLYFDASAEIGKRWSVEWNADSISRKSEGSVAYDHEVTWVGAVTPYVVRNDDAELVWSISTQDRSEIVEKLRLFECVPIFIDRETFVDHYVRSCLTKFRDIFHNVLNVNLPPDEMRRLNHLKDPRDASRAFSRYHSAGTVSSDTEEASSGPGPWEGFFRGSELFAKVILELIKDGVSERDLVWVHNFPLMLVPQFLRAQAREEGLVGTWEPKIVFFLHSPFPTSEIFRTLSVRKELLEGMLGADVVGFHTFDHARHFITSCKRFLGLQFHSQQGGRLVVDYMSRAVLVAISHVGIERHQLDTAVLSRRGQNEATKIREMYRGKTIIVVMAQLTRLKGVPLKLLAFQKLLKECPRYRGKVVLILHGLHTLREKLIKAADQGSATLRDQTDFSQERPVAEVKLLCDKINDEYGDSVVFEEYMPHNWPEYNARAAIWASADILLSTPIMEGLNLLPLEYTFCHRDPAGVVIVSEFSAASRVLNGAIRVNCYDLKEVSRALDQALSMSVVERNARRERDCAYITERSSAQWTRHILMDVEAGILAQEAASPTIDKEFLQGSEYHSVVSIENFMHEGFCQKLAREDIVTSFKSAEKRLILLDYAGTLTTRELGNIAVKRDFLGVSKRKLAPDVAAILKRLCADPRNIVFVISGNKSDVLKSIFKEMLDDPSVPIGIVAFSGVMIRWGSLLAQPQQNEWECILPGVENEWSRWMEAANVAEILEDYTWRTGGSSWSQTAVTTSWQFRMADPEFGGMQAIKLESELQGIINEKSLPVQVWRKKHTVELLPKGMDKGEAVTHILEQLQKKLNFSPQCCFCVGDDTSDEPMYTSVLDFFGSRVETFPCARTDDNVDGARALPVDSGAFEDVFTCTVGRKPTAAQFYVNESADVLATLEVLSSS